MAERPRSSYNHKLTLMGYLSTLIGCRNRYLVPSCRCHHCCPSLQNICIYPFRDHKCPCLNKCENRYQRGKSEGSNRNPRSHHHKDSRRSCRHPTSRHRSDRSRKLSVTANRLHFRGAIPALSYSNSSRARCRMVPILFLRNPCIRTQRQRIHRCRRILPQSGNIRPCWSTRLPRHEQHCLRWGIQTMLSPSHKLLVVH